MGASERQNQVHGQTEIHRDGRSGHSEPDKDGDHIPGDDGQKFSSSALNFRAVLLGCVEVLVAGICIQGEPEYADCQQAQPVHRYEDTLAAFVMQGTCYELRRERQERHDEQQE